MKQINNFFYNKELKSLARRLRNNPTRAERRLWYELLSNRNFGGYKFIRQRSIDHYIVDFFCKELKLIIEVDGKSHEFEDVQLRDAIKNNRLTELGFNVVRVSDWEVLNDMGLVQEVLNDKIEKIKANSPT